MSNRPCGCLPGQACDDCDPDAVAQAIAHGAIPMDVDLEEPRWTQADHFAAMDWDQEVPDDINLDEDNDIEATRLAEDRAYMFDYLRQQIADERGVDIDDLDGYFDGNDNWVDLNPPPARRGTYGRPHLDKYDPN